MEEAQKQRPRNKEDFEKFFKQRTDEAAKRAQDALEQGRARAAARVARLALSQPGAAAPTGYYDSRIAEINQILKEGHEDAQGFRANADARRTVVWDNTERAIPANQSGVTIIELNPDGTPKNQQPLLPLRLNRINKALPW